MYWSPQFLGRSFQKARNFTASSHQNAGFSIWIFKNFPGVIPPDPQSRRGRPPPTPNTQPGLWPGAGRKRPGLGTQTLALLNFSVVAVPLIRNHFPGPLSPFYAAPTPLASGVAQNRFQDHNLPICTWLRASNVYPMPKVQTIDSCFAFYGTMVMMVWNSLLCLTV